MSFTLLSWSKHSAILEKALFALTFAALLTREHVYTSTAMTVLLLNSIGKQDSIRGDAFPTEPTHPIR